MLVAMILHLILLSNWIKLMCFQKVNFIVLYVSSDRFYKQFSSRNVFLLYIINKVSYFNVMILNYFYIEIRPTFL